MKDRFENQKAFVSGGLLLIPSVLVKQIYMDPSESPSHLRQKWTAVRAFAAQYQAYLSNLADLDAELDGIRYRYKV